MAPLTGHMVSVSPGSAAHVTSGVNSLTFLGLSVCHDAWWTGSCQVKEDVTVLCNVSPWGTAWSVPVPSPSALWAL